jgi:hypothetical protein
MKLLTKEIRTKLPPLGSTDRLPHDQACTERSECIIAQAKFFTPDSSWTWFATEFDGEDTLFGLVSGFEVEMGHFSLSELEATRGPWGLPIERDGSASLTTGLWFKPTPLSQLAEYRRWASA